MTNIQDKNTVVVPLVQTVFLAKDAVGVKQIEHFSASIFPDEMIRHNDAIWLNGRYEIHLDYYGIEGKKLYKTGVALPLKAELPRDWQKTDINKCSWKINCKKLEIISPYVLEFGGEIAVAELSGAALSDKSSIGAKWVDANTADHDKASYGMDRQGHYSPDNMVKEVLAEYESQTGTHSLPKENSVIAAVNSPQAKTPAKNNGDIAEGKTAPNSAKVENADSNATEVQSAKQTSADGGALKTERDNKNQIANQATAESKFLNQQIRQIPSNTAVDNADDKAFEGGLFKKPKRRSLDKSSVDNREIKSDRQSVKSAKVEEAENVDLKSLKSKSLLKLKRRGNSAANQTKKTLSTGSAVNKQEKIGTVAAASDKKTAVNQVTKGKKSPLTATKEEKKTFGLSSESVSTATEKISKAEPESAVATDSVAKVHTETSADESKPQTAEMLEPIESTAAELKEETAENVVVEQNAKEYEKENNPENDAENMQYAETAADESAPIVFTSDAVLEGDKTDSAVAADEENADSSYEAENVAAADNQITTASGLVVNLQMENNQDSGFMDTLSSLDSGYFYIKYDRLQSSEGEIWQKTE